MGGPGGFIGPMSIRSIYPDRQESTLDTLECREQSECVSVINSHLSDCPHTIKYHTNVWVLYHHYAPLN